MMYFVFALQAYRHPDSLKSTDDIIIPLGRILPMFHDLAAAFGGNIPSAYL